MGQLRAVLCGYYGKGNGGDEALLASLLQMLSPKITPYVLSGNPVQTTAKYGVESGDRFSPVKVFQALRTSDIFIWGGGSLMQDVTSVASPLYYATLMKLAQLMGLKTIAWGQGIGPLKRDYVRDATRIVLRDCTRISVRDHRSAQLLSNWQIPCILAPDPVWALEASPVQGIWDLRAPRVALTLRPHSQLTQERLHCLTEALVSFQAATNTTILLVPFQPSQDLPIAEKIAEKIPHSHILCLEDPRQLKGVFRGVEMVIGMRLHSLIMAAAEECRCFALSYDPKVTQLMNQVDLPGWELENMPDSPQVICKAWLEEYANGNALSRDRIQSLVDRALMHQDVLQDVLKLFSC